MEVDIPFKEQFEESMLSGDKVCTSRNKKYGSSKDVFQRFGAHFMLVAIPKLPLKTVAFFLYKEEGFSSPEEFIDIWKKLHPRKGYDPEQLVFVHFFIRV